MTCGKNTHVYGPGDCQRQAHHRGICCADRTVAHSLDEPPDVSHPRCSICPRFDGGVCPLCECGLTPMSGLNEDIVFELAGFLRTGSHALGRTPGEGVLGHAARIVREQRRVIEIGNVDAYDR